MDEKEKKVEYLELIYDLIFVYMVGRNNSLLHTVHHGFVEGKMFLAYVMCTLAIIQIWNFTTFYINMFGTNGWRDHIFLLINMYLMYFIGESTRANWQDYQTQYHIAWALILINIGIQYLIERRRHKADIWNQEMITKMVWTLFAEAGLVLIAAIPNQILGTLFSALAILFGIVFTFLGKRDYTSGLVDFMHLTERAMLYVVFTFGEMIIAIASYFNGDGGFHPNTIYFSLMAFLIVAGLFISYETIYDHLLDRELESTGLLYMMIHIFILFALNNITAALEFMQEEEIDLLPKMLFLVGSIIGYYAFLFLLGLYARKKCRPQKGFIVKMLLLSICFAAGMILCRKWMVVNILMTVVYVFVIFGVLRSFREEEKQP